MSSRTAAFVYEIDFVGCTVRRRRKRSAGAVRRRRAAAPERPAAPERAAASPAEGVVALRR